MNDRLTPESVVVRSDDLVSSPLDEELVMMSVERGQYYGLDRVGTHIWNSLEKATRVSDLCEALKQHYDVEPERCRREVLALLENMLAEQLVKLADEQSS